eukprot:TRINITY_DN5697_c0_g2_i1.p1 TRINITY_DN5697_c0_g2~~TRINITY_DN5697_c0_g2_i1.p1  ORF type:complete len:173 (+),score=20.00 TRINITY_DN5697_c0_g2_i1:47-520(+)
MDELKRNKSNWYFFRQRNKRRKEVHTRLQQQLLEMWYDVLHSRNQLNSLSHSFSLSLSHNSAHQSIIYSLNHQLSLVALRIQNYQSTIQNLKSQIQVYQKWRLKISQIPKAVNIPFPTQTTIEIHTPPERSWFGQTDFLFPSSEEDLNFDEIGLFES